MRKLKIFLVVVMVLGALALTACVGPFNAHNEQSSAFNAAGHSTSHNNGVCDEHCYDENHCDQNHHNSGNNGHGNRHCGNNHRTCC